MRIVQFLKSTPGRVLRVILGLLLVIYGTTQGSLLGLVLMMLGMVPAVTGVAGICLLEEIMNGKTGSDIGAMGPRASHVASRHS